MGRLHYFSVIIITTLRLLIADEGIANTKAAEISKKIVFVAGNKSHGYGAHEHYAGCALLARSLEQGIANIETVVSRNGWPLDPHMFDGADSVVLYADGGANHPVNPHLEEFNNLVKQGTGVVCIHYGVEVPKGPSGEKFLDWIGGYFESNWSVNPHWTAKFDRLPKHPITRGVRPFEINDEWYYHMRFREGMQGIIPILTDLPGAQTLVRADGPHSGNQHVRRAVLKNKEPQHVAWAFERADGGRGFGFTGGHFHWNWGDPNFRKLVLNAILWTAQGTVPENGVGDQRVTLENLEANQDYQQPQDFNREQIRKRLKPSFSKHNRSALKKNDRTVKGHNSSSKTLITPGHPNRTPATALDGLDVADDLEATLYAAEPTLLSPTNIDIDHRGRVWVCEVVNYRAFRNNHPMRQAGDRILILADTNGDGNADKKTLFYQSPDIDSAHGICVLPTLSGKGTRVIVSAGDSVYVLTDINGDDKADKSEKLFTGIGGTQHDHGIHAFLFGPDGKLYFNFGNHGKQIGDQEGQPIVDLAGNVVNASRNPYQNGMVFRCNLDGSELETLAWNFRNNWEATVDSFGTLWQSDNDDDGNRGVRINYVMEYGNYGYSDEITGAGWKSPRTNLESEIPLRHWHLHDPGVVPNLLQTGGGSPTGILLYEGRLLPKVYWDTLIHCDAGPNIVRSYPINKEGAGYTATTQNILHGTDDPWFRPSDVCVAPDGALIIADWYDPGVGGHAMGDPDRGRLFRVAPPGANANLPTFDFQTAAGAIQALFNPNLCVRYLAWTVLHNMGVKAEERLSLTFEQADNPRHRARLLWLLGKIAGRGEHYVRRAILDDDADIRIVGIRLARQLKLDLLPMVKTLAHDPSSQVRRECLLALRHHRSTEMPPLWAELAGTYDGQDRWYLEALGIAADRQWDACLAAWLDRVGDDWDSPVGRDIVWRSRAQRTPEYLAAIIMNDATSAEKLPRYFRAFDFLTGIQKNHALVKIAFSTPEGKQKQKLFAFEALSRLQEADARNHRAALGHTIDRLRGTSQFVLLVGKYNSKDHYPELLKMAQADPDGQLGIEAIRTLLSKDQRTLIGASLASDDMPRAIATIQVLGNSADAQASGWLLPIVREGRWNLQLRRAATHGAANTATGAKVLLALAKSGELDERLISSAAVPLRSSKQKDVRNEAARLFPLPAVKGGNLPPLDKLVDMQGNPEQGRAVFRKVGECSKCHIVDQEGHDVGPNLSEIGAKLSRLAMFESIIFPNAGISHNYETYVVITHDGVVATGLKVSETDDAMSIKSEDSIIRTFKKSDIDQVEQSPISLMPVGLSQKITTQEMVDVVEYLTTLKKN